MAREMSRKTPEDFLRECQAEEAAVTKGRLKIFLGYASGVGKSFRMLDEARRRRERGRMSSSVPFSRKFRPKLRSYCKSWTSFR